MLVFATIEKAQVDHNNNMIALLNRCRQRDLHLNPWKLQINWQSMTFMGYELTKDGLQPDQWKIKAITDMPPPADCPSLIRLLEMATYLAKFVNNFNEVTTKQREQMG